MKKISMFCSVLLITLMFCGCNDTTFKDVKATSNETEPVLDKAQGDNVEQSEPIIDDLLYREYKSGEKYFAGEATITKSNLLTMADEPEIIIVMYNGKVQKEITYADTDITIEIPREGTYCFLSVNKDGTIVDITNIADGKATVFEGSNVLPLN